MKPANRTVDKKKGLDAQVTDYKQGYNSSQMQQLLGMLALREQHALASGRRSSSQLARLGKLKVERKMRATVPDAFVGNVPADHPFTCVSVFESILRGEFEPLYGLDGKCSPAARERAATGSSARS